MMNFFDQCYALLGEYNNNWKVCSVDSTNILFDLSDNNNHEVMVTRPSKLLPGKFYLMKYEYISDKFFIDKYIERKVVPSLKIWCPIYVLGFKESNKFVQRYEKNKKMIMYAINLDYLPFRYRIPLFERVFKANIDRIEKNKNLHLNGENVLNELPLEVESSALYNLLKTNGGFEYSLTAYDPDKIDGFTIGSPKLYSISSTIAQRFMFVDCKIINRKNIIDTYKESRIDLEKKKLFELLNSFDKILNDLETDEKILYKKLRQLETHFDLFKS
jgi:hypothetical protein